MLYKNALLSILSTLIIKLFVYVVIGYVCVDLRVCLYKDYVIYAEIGWLIDYKWL